MICEADLNILVANVVSENLHSHCRLCLKETRLDFVRFEDCVSLDPAAENFCRLSEILVELLGHELIDDIPGVDAVCTNCIERLMHCYSFINQCKRSSLLLNKIFTDLNESLNIDIQIAGKGQQLYVVVGENESKVILMDNKNTEPITKPNTPISKPSAPSNQNKITKVKNKQYYCEECNSILLDKEKLKTHNLFVHGTYTCEICAQTYTNKKDLESHYTSEHGFKCPECKQYRISEKSLREHFVKVHQSHMCPQCGKTCRGLDKLQTHEVKHQTAKNVCPKCGKNYVTQETFEKHVQLCLENRIEVHPYRATCVKTFTCDKCDKQYSTSGGLRVHQRFVHGNAQPHICELCGKKFTAPSYLKLHLVTHTGVKNYKCDICNNNLVSKEALLYHKRRHTGEKPYSCKLCSEKFVNASARAEHIKFKHTGPTLTCEICSKKFFTKSFLRQHIGKHHDPSSKLYMGSHDLIKLERIIQTPTIHLDNKV